MLSGPRLGPHAMDLRPPMLFHGQGDNGGFYGRPGQMIRPGGTQGMMQQQAHFRFHPNNPGEEIKLNILDSPPSTLVQLLTELSHLI